MGWVMAVYFPVKLTYVDVFNKSHATWTCYMFVPAIRYFNNCNVEKFDAAD